MSIDSGGRTIQCDGAHCTTTTPAVVVLRPGPAQQRETEDWVFVRTAVTSQHFCPSCAPRYLKDQLQLMDSVVVAGGVEGQV